MAYAVDGLQEAVDALAARLGRSVAVDDVHGVLLVASRHFGDEDPLRTYAVLQRDSDPRVLAHFAAHGVHRWTAPGRVPAAPELGFKARVACPVRAHGIPFGHLFLIDDADDAVSDAEVDLAAGVADEIGALLHRRLVLRERDDGHRAALARDLVGADPDTRAAAARAVLDAGLADAVDPAVALAVRLPAVAAGDPGPVLRLAVDRLTRTRPGLRTLVTDDGPRGTVLVLGAAATAASARAVADRLVVDVRAAAPGRAVVGLGPVTTGPDAAHRSAAEAGRAADAAVLLPTLGDVVTPDDLGAYAVLLALPHPAATAALYPAGLRRLLEHDTHDVLVDTLETYLDCCGDATRTATALRVHRSTLYYRLGRIEALAGVDLHDGADRLALHQGVKLHRVVTARAGGRTGTGEV